MDRLSTLATSTLTSALNVLSTVLPDSMFLSFDRTTAPPLPGLWCWNQMTCHSCPSRLSTMPFFRSFVVATQRPVPVGGPRVTAGVRAGPSPEQPPSPLTASVLPDHRLQPQIGRASCRDRV